MNKQQIATEALTRATTNATLSNYPAIYEGFAAKGISESDIRPRENVFTFHAWRALGRTVRRGEHGVKIVTFIPVTKKTTDDNGDETREEFRRPKTTTVFHISQTDKIDN